MSFLDVVNDRITLLRSAIFRFDDVESKRDTSDSTTKSDEGKHLLINCL
jgi:hypothetical protein